MENQSKLPDLQIIDNKIYKRCEFSSGDAESDMFNWKLWIPSSLIESAITNAHCPPNKCHGGIAKTLERLKLYLYWPRMSVHVKDFITKCSICKQSKSPNSILRPPMVGKLVAVQPFQQVYIDLLGPYPRTLYDLVNLG